MKRITAIEIDNFKAYKTLKKIELQQGQNVLIYGENGSGKSSLFKAFDYFFKSSIENNIPFPKNLRHQEQDGAIRMTFSEFDNITNQLQANSNDTFTSSSVGTNTNGELFIKEAALTKGFLDYTDLLKIYVYKKNDLNFFNFFVFELLGNYIALKAGGNKPLRKFWKDIENKIFNCYSSNARSHKEGISKLPKFEVELRSMLDEVFYNLNMFLDKYFSSMNMHIDYQLDPVIFTYGNPYRGKIGWNIDKNLILKISKNGICVDDYKQALNEASLSALSVCMYLAALKSYPLQQEMKCLFLDDVFIGLDSGNRLPILNILMNEFMSYQVFIATYDRSWFLLAKSAIEARGQLNWIKYLIFEGKDNEGMVPIILEGKDNIELAEEYLYDNKPDYPASANYFRKALEEILPMWMPKNSLTDENCVAIASYRLTKIINEALSLLSRLQGLFVSPDSAIKALQDLKAELHPIIHPLSHFVVDTPVYKQELINICNNVKLLKRELENMNLCKNMRVILGHHEKLRAVLKGTSGWEFYYEFIIDEPVYIYKGSVDRKFSFGRCHVSKMEGRDEKGIELKPFNIGHKSIKSFTYDNLNDGILKIITYLNSEGKTDVVVHTDAISYFDYKEKDGSFEPLTKILSDATLTI